MLYDKVPTNLNFVEREKQTEKFWKDNDIFKKSIVLVNRRCAVWTLERN